MDLGKGMGGEEGERAGLGGDKEEATAVVQCEKIVLNKNTLKFF